MKDLTGYSSASPDLPTFSQSAWDPSIMDSFFKKKKKRKRKKKPWSLKLLVKMWILPANVSPLHPSCLSGRQDS